MGAGGVCGLAVAPGVAVRKGGHGVLAPRLPSSLSTHKVCLPAAAVRPSW